jgi:hypothetical protein
MHAWRELSRFCIEFRYSKESGFRFIKINNPVIETGNPQRTDSH